MYLSEVQINNCYIFESEASLSLTANRRNRKFSCNVLNDGYFYVLKCIGVYGPNNSIHTIKIPHHVIILFI